MPIPVRLPFAARRPAAAGRLAGLVLLASLAAVSAARAQKNSGPLLPVAPAQPAPRPAAPRAAPVPVPQPGPQPGMAGTNPDAERLARTLPLDPATRDMQDTVPPDRRGTERRLGLREPSGPVTDMRGRTPSPREIVDALAPR